MSVFNGTRAIRCRYLSFFALVFISLSQARDALYSKYGLFFCIYFALTFFYICFSHNCTSTTNTAKSHLHSRMRGAVLRCRSIYVSRNLNGKTIQIHSDDCSFSFRISFGFYFQSPGTWILCAKTVICKCWIVHSHSPFIQISTSLRPGQKMQLWIVMIVYVGRHGYATAPNRTESYSVTF